MENQIPKSFMLGALHCNVVIKEHVFLDNEEVCASNDPYSMVIEISEKVFESECSEDYKRQSFYHELIHLILDTLGYSDLSQNENLVQQFSLLLDQFEQTKKFDGD